MFTGIVEEVGILKEMRAGAAQARLTIEASKVLQDVRVGDSIAVNGICLTVTAFTSRQFQVDVMPETVKATNVHQLKPGDRLNLERAMAANGRFGGHIMSGHVDGVGKILSKTPQANAVYYRIETSPGIMPYVVPKGSIAVDGISLTVVDVQENVFSVSIIPHTLQETNLAFRNPGDRVNLECDLLAKYVDNLLAKKWKASSKDGLTADVLAENGFVLEKR